ncbi:pentapeptide repeat-containing protein [Sulfitobacter sp. M57]|uniref:pentapeptide repeat-containing protein n=1 Tax=unclassified Sulfitobacter TaxID=196795 RepID=UPI0023E15E3E|nr:MULTISPECIES: pentapeptide repeat-containing protein [unclassified Sulfitobacter]MDF3461425.1 pentapeptide repeat-containing protein [Sulfitobacter sp. Ks18]MDF3508083.1 pentapeptide repeat-containing protein [Sulfitobacter sp. M57]MDF3511980.1 pentapeptide repeat-containing protein [Sulfitobacter sp. M36]MDF3539296.1 pentapeptide repeat-containing protein [Sulfitobacter sp. M62]MDF3421384.1 pentapeptide repeat-containing protein [Sulfitobacter sp. KE43]
MSEYFAHPLAPVTTIILAMLVILFAQRTCEGLSPSELQSKLGGDGFSVFWFWVAASFWGILFLLLFGGLVWTVIDIIVSLIPSEGQADQIWSWRFSVLKLASLTAVLGAVVALPFTLMRLNLTNTQVETAYEALTNNKMDISVADLHAQRQITRWDGDTASNGWQDDITRRNGAIDRLLGLVEENKDLRPRVDRLLTVYLRELTREFPAEPVPEDATPRALATWASRLTAKRSDMENAVQVLSRLPRPDWAKGEQRLPDLQGINMQGFKLSRLFLQQANLSEAQLQGASLSWAQLQGADLSGAQLQGAHLSRTQLQGAHLLGTKLQGAYLSGAQLQGANLVEAQLQGAHFLGTKLQGAHLSGTKLQGADLSWAQLQGADFRWAEFDSETSFSAAALDWAALKDVNLSKTPQITEHLNVMFGDRSVTLPDGADYPDHWPESDMVWIEFEEAWHDWQRAGGFHPDNPR